MLHGAKYQYPNLDSQYVDAKTPITIICTEHGEFDASPDNHIEEALVLASIQSKATHASRNAEQCCQILTELLCQLLNGKPLPSTLEQTSKRQMNNEVSTMMRRNIIEESEVDIQSDGYVINTLHAALWSTLTTDSFESAVLRACNLGDDADTTAAVAGQIAGAMYGYSNIPQDLKVGLMDERKLYVTSQFLYQRFE